jgi:phosphate:Na+ symporter
LACVGLLLLPSFTSLLSQLHLPPATLVALSHLGFNVVLALIFAPCAVQIATFIERLIPERTMQTTSATRSLSPDALATPAMALGQAMRVVMQMADIFTEMMQISIHAFEIRGREIPDQIEDLDDRLDELNLAIKHYLTSLDEAQMSTGQKQRQIALLYISTDLEVMGDLIDKQWMRLAHRKWRKHIVFSEQDWHDLVRYHQEIMAVLQHACAALAIQDARLAQNFFVQKKELSALKRTLDLQHLQRVQARILPSVESSELHLDILSAMLGILSHASTLVHVVQENLSVSLEEEREELSRPPSRALAHRDRSGLMTHHQPGHSKTGQSDQSQEEIADAIASHHCFSQSHHKGWEEATQTTGCTNQPGDSSCLFTEELGDKFKNCTVPQSQ